MLSIVYRPTASLTPHAANARTHSAEQVRQLAASIKEFGFTNPVLVDPDGGIIAGHGRVLAAQQLHLEAIPTIALPHLTPAQRRAYVLADNRLALNSGWDLKLLTAELEGLALAEVDLALLGFSESELARWAGQRDLAPGKTHENAAPPVEAAVVTLPGDLWRLGAHRLLCGDATSADDVSRLLEETVPGLMVSDPPYGVAYDPAWRHRAGVNTSARTGTVKNDHRADWREAWALFPGDVAYIWHAGLHALTVAESLAAADFELRAQIIWAKDRLVLGRGDYHWQHEPAWYAVRKGATSNWSGDRTQTTLWHSQASDADVATVHGTQKPVEIMRRPMLNNSAAGDAVYEPFLGSGTTLIAAEQTRRVCFALELDPGYVDVAVRRWQAFTGEAAIDVASGRSFDDLMAERITPMAA